MRAWPGNRAGLSGAISLPSGEMRVRSSDEQFEDKSLERSADLRLLRRFYNFVLWYDDDWEAMENASLALSLEMLLAGPALERAYAE